MGVEKGSDLAMRSRRRTIVLTAVAALTIGAAVVPTANAAGPRTAHVATRTITKVQGGYVTRIAYPDGTVVKAFGATPMHMATPPVTGARTSAGSDGANAEHSLSGELVPDVSGSGAAKSLERPATPPSAYQQLLALGVSAGEAAQFKQFDTPPTRAANTKPQTTAGAVPMTTTGPGQLWARNCIDVNFDGAHGHMHGCDDQYRVWVDPNNGANWYMQNRFVATATMHDSAVINPDEVTGLRFGVHYPANNMMYNWAPITMRPQGICGQKSLSVTVKYFTIDSSKPECPEAWGAYDVTNQTFTTKWDGKGNGPHDGSRGTHGVDSVHNPPSGSWNRTLPWTVWWE
jgi:hypothetical protein